MVKRIDRASEFASAAFELFSRDGLDGVKMDDIAAHCGATKGSLYWHYKSKDDVIAGSCLHYYKEWRRVMQRTALRVPGSLDKIRVIVGNSVDSCLLDEGNRVFTMEILARSLHDAPTREEWSRFADEVLEFYLALVDNAIEEGVLELEAPRDAIGLMLSAMEGYKLRATFDPGICSSSKGKLITAELLGLLGIAPSPEILPQSTCVSV